MALVGGKISPNPSPTRNRT
ncbi:hypothetical protein CCACVL1_25077 [Corchorus capsularis]|uniref:Uncharacterized protein n=1 Tax=Corchorus capsularis TaxID=210143 RepID=A0A1R3GM38_COCAP|nr:hypothetical protein CCACVL1_25077 [Corchorus capsularis]